MEEDLEILEKELANIRNLIDYYSYEALDLDKQIRMERFKKAIENLIARNKELEDELKRQINAREITEKYIDEKFIEKSKVREKIEELKGKIEYYKKCANIAKDRVEKRLMCDQINELKTAIKYFEELLQEGDK